MATFTEVFERKEVKYRLSARQHEAMLRALDGRMEIDSFGCTRIMSLYLDTPERALIERSLDKPLYKEKLRLRSYGVPAEQDRVFVEIKKKFDGIVYKRRVGLSYAAARLYLGRTPYEQACERYPLPDAVMAAESLAPRSRQIAREIDRFRKQHGPLRSSMLIVCERRAFVPAAACDDGAGTGETPGASGAAAVEDDVRITFDTGIAYRDLFTTATSDGLTKPLLSSGEAVMEIKCAGSYPLWLVRALDACRAYPTSFSKYGEAYRQATEATCAKGAATPAMVYLPRYAPRSDRAASEEAAERFAADARDARLRRFRVSNRPVKKGGRCA